MPDQAHTDYMTHKVMPSNREDGCKCPYTPEAYAKGEFRHEAGCPSPYVENLPNAGMLMAALRQGL